MNLRALAVVFLLSAACTKNPVGLHFTALCFPQAPNDDGSCPGYDAACDKVLANGDLWVDLAISGGTLEYPVQIDNQLTAENPDTAGVNTNDAQITEFRMEYVDASGGSIGSASSFQSFNVPAAGGGVPFVLLIPPEVGAALASSLSGQTLIFVNVRAAGKFVNGSEFETEVFTIPVYACSGCSTGCPACTTGTAAACPNPSGGQTGICSCITG